MNQDPAPVIERAWCDEDRSMDIRTTAYDSVSHTRGLGDSGKRIQIVEDECPFCGFEGMFRYVFVTPVERDTVEYYCLNPTCRHYHNGQYSFAFKQPAAQEPVVTDEE